MQKFFIIVFLAGCLVACGNQTGPQRPTYHSGDTTQRVDSALLIMMQLNEKMSEEADRQLLKHADGYALWENGCWTKGWKEPATPLQEGEKVQLHMLVYSLDSTLLEDITQTITIGRNDNMEMLDEFLPQLERGSQLSVLVPWYMGYGTTGNEHVAPYINLRVELNIQ